MEFLAAVLRDEVAGLAVDERPIGAGIVTALPGFSTLTTRAPRSESSMVQNGPARTRVRSMTTRSESGPDRMRPSVTTWWHVIAEVAAPS